MNTQAAVRPEALNWSAENCTLGRAMDILGEKWTVVVLREVFLGIRRFEDLRVRTGIPRQVLTNRLAALVGHGLLRRSPYQAPGVRARDEYRLTDKGLDLMPMLLEMIAWSAKYDRKTAAGEDFVRRVRRDRDGLVKELRSALTR